MALSFVRLSSIFQIPIQPQNSKSVLKNRLLYPELHERGLENNVSTSYPTRATYYAVVPSSHFVNTSMSSDGTELLYLPETLPASVYLLRIPKAGSSSFSAFLRLQYNCTSARYPPGDCTRQNSKLCPMLKGCFNHLKPPYVDSYHPPFVTIFRDPISRYVSAFNYGGHHGKGMGGNITRHTEVYPEFDNTQVNFLSGRPIGTWAIGSPIRTEPPNATTLPDAAEREARLQMALRVTSNLTFCGLVEYWHDSLQLFCRMFACPKLQESLAAKKERERQTSALKYPYDDAIAMQAMDRSNTDDIILYQAAKRKFCSLLLQYRQADTVFEARLSRGVLDMCDDLIASNTLSGVTVSAMSVVGRD